MGVRCGAKVRALAYQEPAVEGLRAGVGCKVAGSVAGVSSLSEMTARSVFLPLPGEQHSVTQGQNDIRFRQRRRQHSGAADDMQKQNGGWQ